MDKLKQPRERLFYAQKAIQKWVDTTYAGKADCISDKACLPTVLIFRCPPYESEWLHSFFKDPYQLDFIMLGEEAKERDLENALMNQVTKFLLELGDGFAFMERQKKI
ncbi:PDDEXK nuclease domain-containing protein [Ferruginibacter sp.]|uniref:PDDEXK nuclease domain-containing protein n=1 Tax=Ferruginibacter sp. TaxID=1940288 RepID=UPI002659326E|nr:PDDEXK nuclease domain-containing protein [Ferruginibacter sp.]